jgi:ABC-type amino acid transport substrate-binding protein
VIDTRNEVRLWRTGTLVVVFALLMVSSFGGVSGGATGGSFNLITPGTLTVATWGTSMPEVSVDGNTLGGLDGVWINQFVSDHNLKLKIFQTTFPSSILAVQQGKADMGAYFYWSTARAKQAFYTLPFFADYSAVLTKSSFSYSGPSSLQDKKIGAVVGSVYLPYVKEAFGSRLLVFPDIPQMGQALLNGQVDALVESNTIATEPPLLGRSDISITPIKAGDFGIPESMLRNVAYNVVPCDKKGLADALDVTLQKLMQSGAWAKAVASQPNSPKVIEFPVVRPAQGC